MTSWFKQSLRAVCSFCLFWGAFSYSHEEIEIYPKPQVCQLENNYTKVEKVSILHRSSKSKGKIWEELPETEGAYAIIINKKKLTVYSNDEHGEYYAKQTLCQLLKDKKNALDAHRDPYPTQHIRDVAQQGALPQGRIIDWPDLPFRGVVEGYYGKPWSKKDREAQFEFYGRNKMNTYIYAPKDDSFHHGGGCYKPYPAEKAEEIAHLVKYARKHHVKFVWAIHPANTVNWGENEGKNQLNGLCAKLEQMYKLGVRDFGVFVDDSSGEILHPERQVQLTNYILENFIRKHKDVNQTLIMCPTGYNRGWTNPGFLSTLGNGLDKSIPVMWTGDTVVHDITLPGQQWVNGHVKRPTFIWWNWPCSDFKRNRLSMGRTYGLDTDAQMKKEMSGFVANPMEHAEASKVGLFGVANYTWNITQFDSHASWLAGIDRLYPQEAAAMRTFCAHNSNLLPNVHGYYREESAHIAHTVQQYRNQLAEGNPNADTLKAINKEFLNIAKAGNKLLKGKGDIVHLRRDIEPWIRQFLLLGHAGNMATKAFLQSNTDAKLKSFFLAVNALEEMAHTEREEWRQGNIRRTTGVEVAMQHMTPTAHASVQRLSHILMAALSGKKATTPTFSASCGNAQEEAQAIADDNEATLWSTDCHQEAGQWFCLDNGSKFLLRNIYLLTGGSRALDCVDEVQFEISDDGQTWEELDTPCTGSKIILTPEKPIRTRFVRFRLTKGKQRWLTIVEFGLNRTLPPYAESDIPAQHLSVTENDEGIRIDRVMEFFSLGPRQSIALHLPIPIRAESLHINLENTNAHHWAEVHFIGISGKKLRKKLSFSSNGTLQTDKKDLPKGTIRGVVLTNKSKKSEQIKINTFLLTQPPFARNADPRAISDGNLTTRFDCSQAALSLTLPVPQGAKKLIILGNAKCQVAQAHLQEQESYRSTYQLEPNTKRIRIKAEKQRKGSVYEAIFL